MLDTKIIGRSVDTLVLSSCEMASVTVFKPLHDYPTKYWPYLANLGGIDMACKEDAVFLNSDGGPLVYLGCCCALAAVEETNGYRW